MRKRAGAIVATIQYITFHIAFAIKKLLSCGGVFKRLLAREEVISKRKFFIWKCSSPCNLSFVVVKMKIFCFRKVINEELPLFYSILFCTTIVNLKIRLQEQNLRKIVIFFHFHLNLSICCTTKLKAKLIL